MAVLAVWDNLLRRTTGRRLRGLVEETNIDRTLKRLDMDTERMLEAATAEEAASLAALPKPRTAEERAARTRGRNKLHARRSRQRKKLLVQNLTKQASALAMDIDAVKKLLRKQLDPSSDAWKAAEREEEALMSSARLSDAVPTARRTTSRSPVQSSQHAGVSSVVPAYQGSVTSDTQQASSGSSDEQSVTIASLKLTAENHPSSSSSSSAPVDEDDDDDEEANGGDSNTTTRSRRRSKRTRGSKPSYAALEAGEWAGHSGSEDDAGEQYEADDDQEDDDDEEDDDVPSKASSSSASQQRPQRQEDDGLSKRPRHVNSTTPVMPSHRQAPAAGMAPVFVWQLPQAAGSFGVAHAGQPFAPSAAAAPQFSQLLPVVGVLRQDQAAPTAQERQGAAPQSPRLPQPHHPQAWAPSHGGRAVPHIMLPQIAAPATPAASLPPRHHQPASTTVTPATSESDVANLLLFMRGSR